MDSISSTRHLRARRALLGATLGWGGGVAFAALLPASPAPDFTLRTLDGTVRQVHRDYRNGVETMVEQQIRTPQKE